MRKLSQESPAVAESFARLRQAEDQESLRARRLADQHREQQKSIAKAIGDKKAAVTELKQTKRKIQDMESVSASRHAFKTFTLEALGEGSTNAGGAKGKKNATKYLTAFLAFERASLLVRRTTGNGSGKPGTKKWSTCMVRVGQNFLRPGCRRR